MKSNNQKPNDEIIKMIPLTSVIPCPNNPRKVFSGPALDELAASIREKGVLQPIMVRPSGRKFELIFGERRWQAAKMAAAAGGAGEIPAMVRMLDDEAAFDVMTIENLLRQDLTELEEARSFDAYVKHHGPESIKTLAERTGINLAYIRRRIRLMTLPAEILQAWQDGRLKYGHLELLARSGDQAADFYQRFIKAAPPWGGPITVRDLERRIGDEAPPLAHALFDRQPCQFCTNNTEIQKSLFEDAGTLGEVKCRQPKCFKHRQNDWLLANWTEFAKKHKLGTNGFIFMGSRPGSELHYFWDAPPGACKKCQSLVSELRPSGEIRQKKVCLDSACYRKATKVIAAGKAKGVAAGTSPGPRVAWHGEHFREQFLAERLPEAIEALAIDDFQAADLGAVTAAAGPALLRLALFSLLLADYSLGKVWFAQYLLATLPPVADGRRNFRNDADLFAAIAALDGPMLLTAIRAAAREFLMQKETSAPARRAVAEHLGVDLAAEWAITADYLAKKTTAEILDLGHHLGIFEAPLAQTYLHDRLRKKSFAACKKSELTQVFLESGVNLIGAVPAEILAD